MPVKVRYQMSKSSNPLTMNGKTHANSPHFTGGSVFPLKLKFQRSEKRPATRLRN